MRVIILIALIGAACAVPRSSNRIVGGEETTIENYPFMASMLVHQRIFYCGGTLISSTAVLSAAHCYQDDPPSLWKVRLGSTLASSGGNEHLVSKIILHPNYDMPLHDIAVIKLTEPVMFSDKIKAGRIAGPNYIVPDNTVVHAIGWGETQVFEDDSEILRHVAFDIINHELCVERYNLFKLIPWITNVPDVTPEMICTGVLGVGGKDSCSGDSGGPIIHNGDVVVGIVSWGYQCAHAFFPSINVRVSSYTDWIYTNALD